MSEEERAKYNQFPSKLTDRYLLMSLLGRGGFSEVYLVTVCVTDVLTEDWYRPMICKSVDRSHVKSIRSRRLGLSKSAAITSR